MILSRLYPYHTGYVQLLHNMYAHVVLTMTQAFAQIVGEAKDESELTWDQIADATGISLITVKRIAGRSGPSRKTAPPDIEQLAALARVLKADLRTWFIEAERRVQASNGDD